MKNLRFTILMPVYNGEKVIGDALESILRQDYSNYEIIISDDCSKDNTKKVIEAIKDKRIRYFRNKKNLGYGRNLEKCRLLSSKNSDVMFLMAQDDLIRRGNLKKINETFNKYPEVGATIRPFYMFTDNLHRPIRDFGPYDRNKDTILSLTDDKKVLAAVFRTVCQLSGLALRKSLVKVPFNQDVMTSHIYPFLNIFKNHKIMYFKDYTIAVRTYTSQTRTSPKIYVISPAQSWINLVNNSFKGREYDKIRKICLELVLKQHYVGLIQIKNFSTTKILLREYGVLIKNNLFYTLHPRFWFYVLITFFTPRSVLLPLVDFYKDKILSRFIKSKEIKFIKA